MVTLVVYASERNADVCAMQPFMADGAEWLREIVSGAGRVRVEVDIAAIPIHTHTHTHARTHTHTRARARTHGNAHAHTHIAHAPVPTAQSGCMFGFAVPVASVLSWTMVAREHPLGKLEPTVPK